MYRCLDLSTFWYFYIFYFWECLEFIVHEVIWHDRWTPSYLTEGYSDIFVRWTPPTGCDIVPNWYLCQMFEYFFILVSILQRLGCTISYSSYIYHCFIIMWYMSITQLSNIECNHDHCNSSLWHLFALYLLSVIHKHGLLLFHYHVLVYWSFA